MCHDRRTPRGYQQINDLRTKADDLRKIAMLRSIMRNQSKLGKEDIRDPDESVYLPPPVIKESEAEKALRLERAKMVESIDTANKMLQNEIEGTKFSQEALEAQAGKLLQTVSQPLQDIKGTLGTLDVDGVSGGITFADLLKALAGVGIHKKQVQAFEIAVKSWEKTGKTVGKKEEEVINEIATTLGNIGTNINIDEFPEGDKAEVEAFKKDVIQTRKAMLDVLAQISEPPTLKQVDPDDVSPLRSQIDPDSLMGTLSSRIAERRQSMREGEEDDGAFDDEEEDGAPKSVPATSLPLGGITPLPLGGITPLPLGVIPSLLPDDIKAQISNYRRLGQRGKDYLETMYLTLRSQIGQPETLMGQDNPTDEQISKWVNEFNKKYKQNSRSLTNKGKELVNILLKSQQGSGIKKASKSASKKPFSISPSGQLGKLKIDMKRFHNMYLVAKVGRKKVAEGAISQDLYDLLTKQFNTRRKYDPKALNDFKQLVLMSGLSFGSGQSGKAKVLQGKIKPEVEKTKPKQKYIYYSDPQELLQRLQILIGEIDAGNASNYVKEEVSQLASILKSEKILTQVQYQSLLDSVL